MYVGNVQKNAGMCVTNARIAAGTWQKSVRIVVMKYATIVRISSKTDGMIIAVIVAGQLSRPAWP
jgi:hypothetical protein